jgi:hypothetical protein
MRAREQTITRRAFLTVPTALAVSGATLPQSARAFEAFDPAKSVNLAKAAMLSARHCAHHGFISFGWLPRPFEADLLLDDPTLVGDVAMRAAEVISRPKFDLNDFSKLELVATPKLKHGDRRIWAIAEPQDAVAYLALAVLAAPLIEARRIPSNDNVVHSWRFSAGRHRLFDEKYTLASFGAAARRRAEAGGFVVNCDLANCYGNLGGERIATALEHCGVPGWQVDYISQLLNFWRLEDSPGLPVGPNASRILAESVLLQIDDRLRDAGIEYVRYVDDFRLFAADETGAHQALEAVSDAAASQGLTLNADKTMILNFAEATADDDPQSKALKHQYQLLVQAGTDGFNDGLPLSTKRAEAGEIRALRGAHDAAEAGSFLQTEIASPLTLARAIRRAIYAEDGDFLRMLPQLMARYPEIIAYACSALTPASDLVAADVRDHLRVELASMMLDPATPDFAAVRLIEVLSHPDFRDRTTLERFVKVRAYKPRGVAFRAALDALRNTGGVLPELIDCFEEMDGWGRRALLADPMLRPSISYSSANLDLIAAKLVV